MPNEARTTLQEWISQSRRMVFFGGAGVSTESGIPDFRSEDGLYRQRWAWPPEEILSAGFFESRPEAFFDFYRQRVLALDARPNPAHTALAALEEAGILAGVITQNIDGLHQKAGSRRVLELHGSVWRNHCTRCGKAHPVEAMLGEGLPRCACGGLLRPDVVLYGDSLDGAVLEGAVALLQNADLLVVGGTSLTVYPAAGLLGYYGGERRVLIDRRPPRAGWGGLFVQGAIGEVMEGLTIA